MITREKIDRFRDTVNDKNFIYEKYKMQDGKNLWNCICSAMDWISVATTYLESCPVPKIVDNHDLSSINVYIYISCVDMIFEAIGQLYHILINSNRKQLPFDGDKTCFSDILFCQDDNKYFKLIRACFGAHSVNLEDYFTGTHKERRFASWSGGHFSSRDYGVFLYSSESGGKSIQLDISFQEINTFLERSYGYLDVLAEEIHKCKINEYK